tara:strand:- start:593 stop:1048 length:456 start_codon:yes stop_codon:yes gene_type:complete
MMSICDPLMWRYFYLLSAKSEEEIDALKKGHPKQAKLELASEIVQRYHGASAAEKARAHFEGMFGAENKDKIPVDAPVFRVKSDNEEGVAILKVLVESALVGSNGEGKRLIKQGGLVLNGARVLDLQYLVPPGEHALRAGKKRWAKVIIAA